MSLMVINGLDLNACLAYAYQLIAVGVKYVVIKMGENGALLATSTKLGSDFLGFSNFFYKHYHAFKPSRILDVTGAGDSLVGGTVWALLQGHSIEQSLQFGLKAARLSLESDSAVSPILSKDLLALD